LISGSPTTNDNNNEKEEDGDDQGGQGQQWKKIVQSSIPSESDKRNREIDHN